MVKELKAHEIRSGGEIWSAEHAYRTRSKKVIDGAFSYAEDSTSPGSSEPPVQLALTGTSVNFDLKPKTYYRLVANSPFHFRLSKGADTAVAGDIYVPADMPTVIYSETLWTNLSVVKASGATDGIVQTMRVVM